MTRQINRLSHTKIKSICSKAGRYPDGNGLYLQCNESGSAQWVLRYKNINPNKTTDRYMGLGGYPSISLQKARELRDEAYALRKAGIDPIAHRNALKSSLNKPQIPTFREVALQLIKQKEPSWKNSKSSQAWHNTLATYAFPVIGNMSVAEIETEHLRSILDPIWASKSVTAERLRGRIEAILDFAHANNWRSDSNPARWKGKLSFIYQPIGKFHKVKNHPSLPYKDMPAFYQALFESGTLSSLALRLLILTACRITEVRAMKWSEIDWHQRVWHLPEYRAKNGKGIDIPLSDEATRVLSQLHSVQSSEYVFPSFSASGHLSDSALNSTIKRMGHPEIVAHGFRSTFRVWAREIQKAEWDVAELCLCHTIATKTQKAYLRTDLLDERRLLLEEWSNYCTLNIR